MLDFIQDTVEKILKFIQKANKVYLGIGAAVAIILIIAIVVMITQGADRQKAQLARQQLEQQEIDQQMEALRMDDQPLSPEEIIEREKQLIGEDELPKDLGVAPKETPQPEKPRTVNKSDLQLMSESGLFVHLYEVLPKGKPGPIVMTLKVMKDRDMDVVATLRKVIINSADDLAMRKNAILGLYYIGGKEVIPLLKASARTDPDEGARKLALFCVDFLSGATEKDFFAEIAQNDPAAEIRKEAQEYFEIRNRGQ
ncbi:MAG: HEAT repeat domain-containing protein [Candidatus Omnitrophica bacterium]|nr:HEAT repeat domain-containing protein [Candidatus Omnitrophota bacterium]